MFSSERKRRAAAGLALLGLVLAAVSERSPHQRARYPTQRRMSADASVMEPAPLVEQPALELSTEEPRAPGVMAPRAWRPTPEPPPNIVDPPEPAPWTPPSPDGTAIASRSAAPSPLTALLPDTPGAPAPAPTEIPRRYVDSDIAGKLIGRRLREHDEGLGLELPGAGAIGRALVASVRPLVPPRSRGYFLARVGNDGVIDSLVVSGFDAGEASAWEQAAASAKAALNGARMTMHGDLRSGALVEVIVTSDVRLPSGAGGVYDERPIPELEKPGWPFAPRGGPRLSQREEGIENPLPFELESLGRLGVFDRGYATDLRKTRPADEGRPRPESGRDGEGEAPGSLASGTFDLADLGAHAQRVVGFRLYITPVEVVRQLVPR